MKDRVINFDALRAKLKFVWEWLKWPATITLVVFTAFILNRYFLNSGRVNHQLILQYLEALKWPIILITISVLFRGYIPGLIDRMSEFGPGGAKFRPSPQQVSSGEEQEIRAATQAPSVDLSSSDGRKQALENESLRYALEKVYRIIYQSQIDVLVRLAAIPNGQVKDDMIELYKNHCAASQTTWSFEEYMKYLEINSFVSKDADTSRYKITDIGRLFVDYLNEEGLIANRYRPE